MPASESADAWGALTANAVERGRRLSPLLAEMEAERLDDMGIDRTAARREAAKPFWRA